MDFSNKTALIIAHRLSTVIDADRIVIINNGEIADSFYIAPDWVIEILSPEQSQTKVVKNILYCLDY